MTTIQQLDSFTQYAREQIECGTTDLSLDEIYDAWRATTDQRSLDDSVAAVQAAIQDMKNGDTGIEVERHLAELRETFDIVVDR